MKVTIGKKNENPTGSKIAANARDTADKTRKPAFTEIAGKRGRYRKVFTNGKGDSIAAFYGKPVCRKTEKGYELVDNTLTETDDGYRTASGGYDARFFKRRENGKVFDVEKDQCRIGLFSRDVVEHDCTTENCESEDEDGCRNGKIVLHGIRENTDIEYLAESDRIKENIIIKERSDSYEYEFDLALDNLTVKASADGKSLEIINKGNGTLWGYIPAPFMYDANGERSDDVYYEIVAERKDLSLKVIADERWINSEERAFPVVIDPQIVITNYYGYGYETEEYDDGIFEFNTYSELPFSGTRELIGHEVRAEADEDYPMPDTVKGNYVESDIIIHKSKINQLIFANMTKAVLKFNILSSTATSFNVNEHVYSVQDNRNFTLDITNMLKQNENEENIIVTVSQYAARGTYYAGATYYDLPVLEIEYNNKPIKIDIVKALDRIVYRAGDRYDSNEIEIKATFINGETLIVNDYICSPSVLSLSTEKVTVSYTYDGETFTAEQPITVLPQALADDTSNYTGSAISKHVELDPARNERVFSAAGGAHVLVNLENGESKVKFDDASTEDSPISVDISHLHNNGNNVGKGYGKGMNLNVNETLTGEEDGTYVYTDGFGRVHSCEDVYYYIDSGNRKTSIHKSSVTVESDGKLTYNGYDVVKESCSETGLTFGGELKGSFRNVKYFDQRSDDRKQIEEQIESYKNALEQYVIAKEIEENFSKLVYKKALNIAYRLKNYMNSSENFEKFISYAKDNPFVITESESLNIGSMYNQIRSANETKRDYENQKSTEENKGDGKDQNLIDYLGDKIKLEAEQINISEEQIGLFKDKKAATIDSLETYYKTYLALKSQLEELKRSEPVNYASDGNIVRAFNENGDLVALVDAYENTVVFERDERGKVIGVYNGEDKEISFGYNGNGYLAEITDGRGRKVNYEYSDGRIGNIAYPDGTHIDLTYDSDYNITKIAYSNGETTELTYASGKLIKIKTLKNDTELDGAEIEYALDKTTVIMPSGEEIYDYANGKLSGYTEIADGRVVQSEKYSCEYNSDGRKASTHIERAKASALNSFGINEFNYVKGESVDIVYDDFGQQKTKTENGLDGGDGVTKRVTTYTYDNDHHPVYAETKVYGANRELLYTAVMKQDYNVFGKVVREESYIVGEENTSGVSVTEHYYDDKGREIKSFSYNSLDSGSKFVTEHSYDDIGRETAAYGETGECTAEYEYFDGTRSVRSEKYAGGGALAYGKDISDNVTAITQSTEDGEENSTLTRYDNGRVAEVKSGDTSIGYEYDDKGRITKIKYGGSDYITCAYTEDIPNADGSDSDKVTVTNAKGEVFEKVTDKSGNVQSVTYLKK